MPNERCTESERLKCRAGVAYSSRTFHFLQNLCTLAPSCPFYTRLHSVTKPSAVYGVLDLTWTESSSTLYKRLNSFQHVSTPHTLARWLWPHVEHQHLVVIPVCAPYD